MSNELKISFLHKQLEEEENKVRFAVEFCCNPDYNALVGFTYQNCETFYMQMQEVVELKNALTLMLDTYETHKDFFETPY